ncbi:nuclease-related domain-containing protein [Arthrobacter sp. VKM Ac-2550]|uniref:nuclease-related domain-containing protein n=1 Tax=Crystallibacter permensis TaxID=1938888 RepID=UPI0022276A52|nr:nuclease-related domain-containing protein [Arthrobacter sp. VKM Ac-2550]MCW2135010.1 Nuclease-related domain-containing protein [Arthrobacter sp. VKM Ac-2550]
MANGTFGTAAAGLDNAHWAKNQDVAAIGAKGELRTAEILDSFAGRAAILHDLRIPIKGISANIDHVVVNGRRVLILDSKVWAPGIYWSLGGVNRRGLQRVVHTQKKTMEMARSSLVRFLDRTRSEVVQPKVVVWSSRTTQPVRTILFQVPGADVLKGEKLAQTLGSFIGRQPADQQIVDRLSALLVRSRRTALDHPRTTSWTTPRTGPDQRVDRSGGPLQDHPVDHPMYSRSGMDEKVRARLDRMRNDDDPFAA